MFEDVVVIAFYSLAHFSKRLATSSTDNEEPQTCWYKCKGCEAHQVGGPSVKSGIDRSGFQAE